MSDVVMCQNFANKNLSTLLRRKMAGDQWLICRALPTYTVFIFHFNVGFLFRRANKTRLLEHIYARYATLTT